MMNNKVWLITGAGRGMGVDITKAALAAGHKVVATGRNTYSVAEALGENENLLIVKLDVTNPADAEAAVNATVKRFSAGAGVPISTRPLLSQHTPLPVFFTGSFNV